MEQKRIGIVTPSHSTSGNDALCARPSVNILRSAVMLSRAETDMGTCR